MTARVLQSPSLAVYLTRASIDSFLPSEYVLTMSSPRLKPNAVHVDFATTGAAFLSPGLKFILALSRMRSDCEGYSLACHSHANRSPYWLAGRFHDPVSPLSYTSNALPPIDLNPCAAICTN